MQSNFRLFEELVSLICGFRNPDSEFWFSVPVSGLQFPCFMVACTFRLKRVTFSLIPRFLFIFPQNESISETLFVQKISDHSFISLDRNPA